MSDRSGSDSESHSDSERGESRRENIPDAVDHFLGQLLSALKARNVPEIHKLYEKTYNECTEKFYRTGRWPSAEAVKDQISEEPLFIILYKELYYRHVYSKNIATFQDRVNSWANYCKLLDLITDDLSSGEDLSVDLPAQWIWDILDEFIYHYQTYRNFLTKAAKIQKEQDITNIKDNTDVFDTTKVLCYLHQLIQHSQIEGYLAKAEPAQGRSTGAYTDECTRYIGYFSLMQLLRMHSLLGDYYLSMQTIQCVDFGAEAPLFYKIPACHVSLYYYMGFAYMMMRRYVDATKTYSDILVFLSKTSGVNAMSYQYGQMVKKQDQMFGLLLICLALCPRAVDESLEKTIREKHVEKQSRLQRGEENCFEELFSYACPKFVSAAMPDFENVDTMNANEAHHRQLHLFLQEVRQQQFLPKIGAYMKLYTAIKVSKLAQLCEMDDEGLRDQLMCVMHKMQQCVHQEGAPLSGNPEACAEVEFYLDGDMVHINAHRPERPYADVFLEQILKFQDLFRKIDRE